MILIPAHSMYMKKWVLKKKVFDGMCCCGKVNITAQFR